MPNAHEYMKPEEVERIIAVHKGFSLSDICVRRLASDWQALMEENRNLRKERDELLQIDEQRDRQYYSDGETIDELKFQLQSAQEEKKKLVEALRFTNQRSQIALSEEDEWGWRQALVRILESTRDTLKELGEE